MGASDWRHAAMRGNLTWVTATANSASHTTLFSELSPTLILGFSGKGGSPVDYIRFSSVISVAKEDPATVTICRKNMPTLSLIAPNTESCLEWLDAINLAMSSRENATATYTGATSTKQHQVSVEAGLAPVLPQWGVRGERLHFGNAASANVEGAAHHNSVSSAMFTTDSEGDILHATRTLLPLSETDEEVDALASPRVEGREEIDKKCDAVPERAADLPQSTHSSTLGPAVFHGAPPSKKSDIVDHESPSSSKGQWELSWLRGVGISRGEDASLASSGADRCHARQRGAPHEWSHATPREVLEARLPLLSRTGDDLIPKRDEEGEGGGGGGGGGHDDDDDDDDVRASQGSQPEPERTSFSGRPASSGNLILMRICPSPPTKPSAPCATNDMGGGEGREGADDGTEAEEKYVKGKGQETTGIPLEEKGHFVSVNEKVNNFSSSSWSGDFVSHRTTSGVGRNGAAGGEGDLRGPQAILSSRVASLRNPIVAPQAVELLQPDQGCASASHGSTLIRALRFDRSLGVERVADGEAVKKRLTRGNEHSGNSTYCLEMEMPLQPPRSAWKNSTGLLAGGGRIHPRDSPADQVCGNGNQDSNASCFNHKMDNAQQKMSSERIIDQMLETPSTKAPPIVSFPPSSSSAVAAHLPGIETSSRFSLRERDEFYRPIEAAVAVIPRRSASRARSAFRRSGSMDSDRRRRRSFGGFSARDAIPSSPCNRESSPQIFCTTGHGIFSRNSARQSPTRRQLTQSNYYGIVRSPPRHTLSPDRCDEPWLHSRRCASRGREFRSLTSSRRHRRTRNASKYDGQQLEMLLKEPKLFTKHAIHGYGGVKHYVCVTSDCAHLVCVPAHEFEARRPTRHNGLSSLEEVMHVYGDGCRAMALSSIDHVSLGTEEAFVCGWHLFRVGPERLICVVSETHAFLLEAGSDDEAEYFVEAWNAFLREGSAKV